MLHELTAAVDAASGCDAGAGGRPFLDGGLPPQDNCLGLEPRQFAGVIAALERSCHISTLREALQCRTPEELVALVNTQVISGV
jgi:hypothetical protein